MNRFRRRGGTLVLVLVACATAPAAVEDRTGFHALEKTRHCRLTRVLDEASLGVGKRTSPYRSLSLSPAGDLLVDATLVSGGKVARRFTWRDGVPVVSSALTADGRFALVFEAGGADEIAGIAWDTATGKRIRTINLGRELDRGWVIALAVTPTGEAALLGDSADSLWLWKFTSEDPPKRIARSDGAFVAVAISADGRLGLAADAHGLVGVYDLGTGRVVAALEGPSPSPEERNPDILAFGATADEALILDESARLERRATLSGKSLQGTSVVSRGERGTSLRLSAFSPDRRWLLRVAPEETSLALISLETFAEVDRLDLGEGTRVQAVAFSPDSRSFAIETTTGKILELALEP